MSEGVIDEGQSNFERALHSWALIDLPTLQKSLDSEGLAIQEFQKSSLLTRKELATKTKSFKKLEADSKLSEINALLKSYQNEIDSLTKKNKSIESTFFDIYRAIADAPDPKPLLESAIAAVGKVQDIDSLRKENQALQNKLVEYADYDQLQRKVEVLESQMDQKLANKEKELQAEFTSKEKRWKEKESNYIESQKQSEKEVEELKISIQVMELKLNNQNDIFDNTELNNKATNIIELEMIQRTAETYKAQVLALEKKNDDLHKQLTQLENKDNFKDKIDNLTAETLKLRAKLDHDQSLINNLRRDNVVKNESTMVEVKQLKSEIESLKERLRKTSDYDELKKELDVLKEIEFGAFNLDETESGADDEQQTEKRLDSIIMQTNRKLNTDLVEYRSKHEAMSKTLRELEEQNKHLQAQVKDLSQMNKNLENDLSNISNNGSSNTNNNWETASIVSTVSKPVGSNSKQNGRLSPAASIAGSLIDANSEAAASPTTSLAQATAPAASSNSILPIITQQRDRFKARNKELEDEAKKQFSKVVDMKRELLGLKKDNKELYERIRYLSSYASNNQNEKTKNNSLSAPEQKYEKEYEQELHPIEQFRLKESRRISSRINPLERIYISVIRLVLSSPLSRYLFAAYCCGLHFLIMILFMYATNLHMEITPDVTEGSTGGNMANMGHSGDTIGEFEPS